MNLQSLQLDGLFYKVFGNFNANNSRKLPLKYFFMFLICCGFEWDWICLIWAPCHLNTWVFLSLHKGVSCRVGHFANTEEWQNLALAFYMLWFLFSILMCDFVRCSLPPIQTVSQHGLWEEKENKSFNQFLVWTVIRCL